MHDGFSFNELETRLKMTLDALSNRESVHIEDDWIEQAGEDFKASLRRQLHPSEREFRLRASNIGKPLCQLQQEQAGTPAARMDYNHIIRMLIGDAVETITMLALKAAGTNITGGKNKVELDVNGTIIKGEDDVWIDDKVWDVKSCSTYAFQHKWAEGWRGVYYGDTFGYVAQLYTYAGGDFNKMGGWIVIDKSSGEIKVVEATPTPDQEDTIRGNINTAERTITNNLPFRKQFEAEEETHYKKPTGSLKVPMVCTFCSFMHTCWPDAVSKTPSQSKAQNARPVWYTHYEPKVEGT